MLFINFLYFIALFVLFINYILHILLYCKCNDFNACRAKPAKTASHECRLTYSINTCDKGRKTKREGEVAASTIPPAVSVFTNVFVAVSRYALIKMCI